jgi:hypothetical protein
MANVGDPKADSGDAPVNFFFTRDDADQRDDDDDGSAVNLFTPAKVERASKGEPEPPEEESERSETLFGSTGDQPPAEGTSDGYTAAGIAGAAEAKSVPELMVSAAAWMVLIQGQTTFSRNEVVEVFEAMPGDHVKTPEARIKGFGKALRNGQFVLVEEGVYGLSRTELERFQRLL